MTACAELVLHLGAFSAALCIGHTKKRAKTFTPPRQNIITHTHSLFASIRQMHATHYGFHSTSGVKHFFGRNADLSERLVPERKPYLCKVMSSKEDIQPSENDILLGRGGKNNQHSGNEKLRAFARVQARKYNTSSKKGKSILSRILVKQMRELDPPARCVDIRVAS
jgi:hypothetical protein